MGTNYYAIKKCTCCGNEDSYHIGKSSGGWTFSLHVEPNEDINDLQDVLKIIEDPERIVKDEYDRVLSKSEMLDTIKNRKCEEMGSPPTGYRSWKHFHILNDTLEGPNNLLRHKLKYNCIAHGEGTWDCIEGEFF